jgi:23S rRNA (adenine1618-N6)-methyltransferase
MLDKKKEHPKEKTRLHVRNKHRERYHLKALIESVPELAQYVSLNIYNDESIDFFNPEAVKALNKALLKHHYQIDYWNIPPNYLCPPIPGRADYIHYIADLLCGSNYGKIPKGNLVTCLDIGVGANCVYPIIGYQEYGWNFIGSDIDPEAIISAKAIVESNPALIGHIDICLQNSSNHFFKGVIQDDEYIDVAICNPPFHSSQAEAQSGTLRKLSNLNNKKVTTPTLNFGGQSTELCCNGGEARFVNDMIFESKQFATSCFWFSTLISKQSNLNRTSAILKQVGATDVKTIPMGQGNKSSRIVAWTFLSKEEQKTWANTKWNKVI